MYTHPSFVYSSPQNRIKKKSCCWILGPEPGDVVSALGHFLWGQAIKHWQNTHTLCTLLAEYCNLPTAYSILHTSYRTLLHTVQSKSATLLWWHQNVFLCHWITRWERLKQTKDCHTHGLFHFTFTVKICQHTTKSIWQRNIFELVLKLNKATLIVFVLEILFVTCDRWHLTGGM